MVLYRTKTYRYKCTLKRNKLKNPDKKQAAGIRDVHTSGEYIDDILQPDGVNIHSGSRTVSSYR